MFIVHLHANLNINMETSPSLCNNCKSEIETQDIAIQTESTEYAESDFIIIHSPGSRFTVPSHIEMVKLQACLGDIGEIDNLMNCSDLSSIQENSSVEEISILQSFIEEDSGISEKNKKCWKRGKIMKPKDALLKKKPSAGRELDIKNRIWSRTPNFHKYHKSKLSLETDLSESYEEMIETLGINGLGVLKESFLQLIQVEKKSVRKQFYKKRYPSTYIVKDV